MASLLSDAGYGVVEQVVDGPRRNIYAAFGKADVVLSTHLDCVPPFFPSHATVTGCSAAGRATRKGIAACQVAAVERLRRQGVTNVGLLFVVGEERGSDGAKAAQALASGSKFLINGEPTDNRLGIGTRGALRYNLRAKGRAAHSSFPELGESAIEKLIDALIRLRTLELPEHPVLGRTHYTVGIISGGVAPNVIPSEAEAEVMFRTVADLPALRAVMTQLTPLVSLEEILDVPPVIMPTVPGFDTATFPYTTDIPFLSNWGTPLLYGPGSIHVAHTDNEHVRIADLKRAVDDYATARDSTLLRSEPIATCFRNTADRNCMRADQLGTRHHGMEVGSAHARLAARVSERALRVQTPKVQEPKQAKGDHAVCAWEPIDPCDNRIPSAMDLRQLEIVQAVAETGSFTGAGRKLHVSQSAISRQILLLEDELNESIFLRVGRRIRITPAGDSLVQLSHRVFGDIKETVTVIGESQQVLSGTIRLAGGMTVCMYVFPALLQEYRRQHSMVEVKLITGTSQRLLQEIRSGAADLGFITLPGERARARHGAGDGRGDAAGGASLASAREEEAHRAAGSRAAAVRAVRGGVELAPGRRRVLHQGAHRAAHRHGDRERRDSEGAGAVRDGHYHHPVSGRRARSPEPAAVLREDLRRAARASHRAGSISGPTRFRACWRRCSRPTSGSCRS